MPDKKPILPGIYDTFDVDNPAVSTVELRKPTAEEVSRAEKIFQDLKAGKFSHDEVHKNDEDEE